MRGRVETDSNLVLVRMFYRSIISIGVLQYSAHESFNLFFKEINLLCYKKQYKERSYVEMFWVHIRSKMTILTRAISRQIGTLGLSNFETEGNLLHLHWWNAIDYRRQRMVIEQEETIRSEYKNETSKCTNIKRIKKKKIDNKWQCGIYEQEPGSRHLNKCTNKYRMQFEEKTQRKNSQFIVKDLVRIWSKTLRKALGTLSDEEKIYEN